jgi:hypothetical protein
MHQTLQLNFMKQFGIELTEIRYAIHLKANKKTTRSLKAEEKIKY